MFLTIHLSVNIQGANALNISHLALTRRRRTRQFLRTQDGTGRAAEIRDALAGPQRPRKRRRRGPSPPLPGRLRGTTFAEQRNSNSRSSRRKRWKATPTALPLPAPGRRSDSGSCSGGSEDVFFFLLASPGLTQVDATETEK